jgi:hypothetical protein
VSENAGIAKIQTQETFKNLSAWATTWHTPVIPATQVASSSKKVKKPYFKKQARWHMPIVPAMQEMELKGSRSQGCTNKKPETSSKTTKAKRVGLG